jgi:hypothetical protein
MRNATLLLLIPLLCARPGAAEEPADALADALAAMGIAESDLGYRPLAHWARDPHPS